MRLLCESSEEEMVAVFLRGELTSDRFGAAIRALLDASGRTDELLTSPNLLDEDANNARRALLAATRGYGENRELFTGFPSRVRWTWLSLTPEELARVRYIEYSYWRELSGGSRLPIDAVERIKNGVRAYDVSNQRFVTAARAVTQGQQFLPLILAGSRTTRLVCLEGHLRLTAYALAGFPRDVDCLVGIAPDMARWAL